MCINKHLCVGIVEQLLAAKKILKERIPRELKANHYNQPQLVIDEVVDRVYNEIFMMEKKK